MDEARCARGPASCAARRLPRAPQPAPPHLCCGSRFSRARNPMVRNRGRWHPAGALWRTASSAGSGAARAQRALRGLTCRSLFERSERSERSEFCGTPPSRAAQRSRRAAPTVAASATWPGAACRDLPMAKKAGRDDNGRISKRHKADRALRHRRRRPRRLGLPGDLGPADVVQDRARRARLSAEVHLRADARQLPRGDLRRLVHRPEHLVERRRRHRRDAADDAVRRARRLCAGAPALPGQARLGLLRAGDADAAAGRPDHSLLPGAAEDRRARQLQRPDAHLPHVLAAVRGLADGLVLRGRAARDGRGGTARPGRAAAHPLVRDPAAGAGAGSR